MANPAVLKFSYEVLGQTLEEVAEKLDALVLTNTQSEGGEPWVILSDKIERLILNENLLVAGDPSGWLYKGGRTVLFAGPSTFGEQPKFTDGFRPQSHE